LRSFEKAEGVSPAIIGGMERIIIVSDDGNGHAGRFASLLLLDPAQLQTAACSTRSTDAGPIRRHPGIDASPDHTQAGKTCRG
jgi:hypothetical protein